MRDGLPRRRGAIRIAAFDVDGTLLDGQLGRPLLAALIDAGLVSGERFAPLRRHLAAMPPDGFEQAAVIAETYRLYAELVRGVSCEAFDEILGQVWERQRGDLFGFVAPLVGELRDAGFVPMLISGGLHELVGLLASELGVEHYRGMRLERAGGGFSGRVSRPAGVPKDEIARDLAAGRVIRWSDSVAVGDSLPDAALLARVGHPLAFEPTPSLAGRARERGWMVCGRDTLRPIVQARLGMPLAAAASRDRPALHLTHVTGSSIRDAHLV
jgi:phosphoserine phosphatase